MSNVFAELNKEVEKQKKSLDKAKHPSKKKLKKRKVMKSVNLRRQSPSIDVTTSVRHDVTTDLKSWKKVIEDTEVQSSALRLTVEEKEKVEDLITDLKRKYKIKSSMNELARLGLLYLRDDYNKKGKDSLILKVKDA